MKIGIIGTRGIPNHYGGFEQFAEYLSVYLVGRNHEVFVYNSSEHPYKKNKFKKVHLVHCYDPEKRIGTVGQFIYDLNCIIHSRKMNYDIILQLGYTSSSIWSFLMPKKSIIITNMDGFEWKRSKYNSLTKFYLKFAEKLAVNKSNFLISDAPGIQSYLKNKYNKNSKLIAYGGVAFTDPNFDVLKQFKLDPLKYNMLIARIVPENNIETILEGIINSNNKKIFIVIGNYDDSKYGKSLFEKYKNNKQIKFLGGIYDINILNNLRYFSNLYFHGHSVGGTNPSLIEAMASNALIVAHDNEFNKYILKNNAYYFKTIGDVKKYSDSLDSNLEKHKIEENFKQISINYNYDNINEMYLNFFYDCIN